MRWCCYVEMMMRLVMDVDTHQARVGTVSACAEVVVVVVVHSLGQTSR